ncbi:cytoplasmic protein [Kwoniella heveanensis CBS 569]|nr:cytoplasmic protein [Kwoniella heveanensis CBS 569]
MFARSLRAVVQAGPSRPRPICAQCLQQIAPARGAAPRMPTNQPPQFARYASSSSLIDRSKQNNGNRTPKLPVSHKPPKRRLEAASQPLRNVASHTRGPVLQCIAHTTAERYDLLTLGSVLRSLGVRWDEVPEGDRDRAFVIGPWKGRGGAERLMRGKDLKRTTAGIKSPEIEWVENEEDDLRDIEFRDMGFGYGERGEIWVFNSGSFVTWGLTEEEGRAFLREVIRRKGSNVEVNRLAPQDYEVEEVDFVVDPTAKTHILGNLILFGRPPQLSTFHSSPSLASLLARYTLSLSLSRSSSLSVLEDRLDKHIATVSVLPRALEKHGRQPLARKEVIRKMGELMTLRMAVNTSGGGLDDTPEFYWSEPELESYFDSVASEFEIKERIDAFNKKLDYAQEVQSTLRALLTESSAHRMEIIIILLIAVEVVIVLIREGPELVHKLGEYLGATPEKTEKIAHALEEVREHTPAPGVLASTPTVHETHPIERPSESRRLV